MAGGVTVDLYADYGALRYFTISGVVRNLAVEPLSRRVIAFRGGSETTLHASTQSSAVDGTFSLTVNGGLNDRFKVEALGIEGFGEGTKCFDFVKDA